MINLQQNTPEWLEFRKNYLGASDAPIIMGVSPWKTPYQLWQEKLGIAENYTYTSAMQRGHDLEDKAREFFTQKTGHDVYPEVVLHPTIDWMMASVDGRSVDGKVVVEIKCPGAQDHSIAKKGSVPTKYYPQLQHQIEVCQIDSIYYLSFDGEDGVILKVEKDLAYISQMLQKQEHFWNLVNTFQAPDLCDADFENRNDDIWLEAAAEWIDIQKRLRALQDREDELRELIGSMAKDKNCQGGGIKVTKVLRRGAVDYSKIPEIQGIDLEQYRRANTQFFKISNLPY